MNDRATTMPRRRVLQTNQHPALGFGQRNILDDFKSKCPAKPGNRFVIVAHQVGDGGKFARHRVLSGLPSCGPIAWAGLSFQWRVPISALRLGCSG